MLSEGLYSRLFHLRTSNLAVRVPQSFAVVLTQSVKGFGDEFSGTAMVAVGKLDSLMTNTANGPKALDAITSHRGHGVVKMVSLAGPPEAALADLLIEVKPAASDAEPEF